MRLVAVMPLWQRHDLTALILRQWWWQIHRLRGRVDVALICVGSEGARSAALVSGYSDGISYVEADNDPLTDKWTKGIRLARAMQADAVMIVGSDDLLGDSLFLHYAELLQDGHDFFGLRDLYFFDAVTHRLGYWPGYAAAGVTHRAGEPVGCGRCHSRKLLDAVDWRIWPETPARNRALDLASLQHLAAHGFRPATFGLDELEAKAVDVKAEGNLTTFERIPFATMTHGAAALAYLAELVDEAGFSDLSTRWRAVAA